MTGHKPNVWVLIADSVHAQLYGVKTMMPLRIEALDASHFSGRGEATPHTATGPAGLKFGGEGGARQHIGRHPDPHQVDKEIFIEHLGDFINSANEQNKFDELIVVAPSHALGELRRILNAQVHKKIKVEVPGEWTKLPHAELEQHLANHIPQATPA